MVKCRICQKELGGVSYRHVSCKHGITLTQYLERFPEAVDEVIPRPGWNRGMKMGFNAKRGQAISKALKGRKITWGDKISQVKKEQFRDPEFARRMIVNITRHASSVRPNKPEQKMLAILDKLYPKEWEFVGNYKLAFDGLSPDFANVNGRKVLIEVFGDYWHRGQNPQDRIDHFKRFGFSTLVIWERELKNPAQVEKKIVDFLSIETLHELPHVGKDKVRHFLKRKINSIKHDWHQLITVLLRGNFKVTKSANSGKPKLSGHEHGNPELAKANNSLGQVRRLYTDYPHSIVDEDKEKARHSLKKEITV